MTTRYVAAEGRAIPGGWPDDGQPINELSLFHRRMVKDGDLVPMSEPSKSKGSADKKDEAQ